MLRLNLTKKTLIVISALIILLVFRSVFLVYYQEEELKKIRFVSHKTNQERIYLEQWVLNFNWSGTENGFGKLFIGFWYSFRSWASFSEASKRTWAKSSICLLGSKDPPLACEWLSGIYQAGARRRLWGGKSASIRCKAINFLLQFTNSAPYFLLPAHLY